MSDPDVDTRGLVLVLLAAAVLIAGGVLLAIAGAPA